MPEILSTEISMEIDTPLEDSAKKSNVRLSGNYFFMKNFDLIKISQF